MKNVWFLLIWLAVVSLESISYNVFVRISDDDDCLPTVASLNAYDIIKMIDRMVSYQSWFIPLIWLYWPTKARKRENRSRKRAIDQLIRSTAEGGDSLHPSTRLLDTSDINNGSEDNDDDNNTGEGSQDLNSDDFSGDGYSSLDPSESYLDIRKQSVEVFKSGATAGETENSTANDTSSNKRSILTFAIPSFVRFNRQN